jgi:alcohol dehydrogenase (cytochrome c)
MIARVLLGVVLTAGLLEAQVGFDRILHPEKEPQNWLTYSGSLTGQRFSPLTQINTGNVKNLELQWIWQAKSLEKYEATALVVDGVMYTVTGASPATPTTNDVVALDAASGRIYWTYTYTNSNFNTCCGRVIRGLAILGDTLYMGTLDAHLIAIDAKTGRLMWNTTVADAAARYSITHAPLVVKDKVLVGTAGGDGPIRGLLAAFDAKTGKEAWRFYTIPGPGEPGNETWSGESWKNGGAGIWNTGAYDPETNLTFWGTGNPSGGSDWNGATRLGDNLYSDSVLALDADTGKLKWHYQFTPHDEMDYDSTQVPRAHRYGVSGQDAQGDAVGQSKWVDVRSRSHHRRVSSRQAFHERQLDGWIRRQRPAPPRCRQIAGTESAGHHAHSFGRNQLVSTVL